MNNFCIALFFIRNELTALGRVVSLVGTKLQQRNLNMFLVNLSVLVWYVAGAKFGYHRDGNLAIVATEIWLLPQILSDSRGKK